MTTYRVASGTSWSVGRTNLTVSDGRGAVWTFVHPEAALWDLLSRGTKFDAAVELMRHIASMNGEESAAFVRAAIEAWHEAGLLEAR
jgi:hypothetical protein